MDTFTEVGHHGRGPKPELLCVAPETRPKPREDRKYRGMAMLDDYDNDMRSKDLGYDYDKTEEQPRWKRYFGKIMFLSQMSMLVGAAIMFGGAFTAERNGFDYANTIAQVRFGEMDPDVLYIPYGCAALTGITALVGCLGVFCVYSTLWTVNGIQFRHRYILTPYVVLLGITLALAIGGAMQAKADYYNVYYYAKRQWWEMTYQQEQLFQHHFLCCNFDHVDPCCRWAVGEGACENEYMCFDRIRPHLMEQFKIISSTAAMHAVICGIVMCMALGLVITLQIKRCVNGEYDGDIPLKQLAQSLTSMGKNKENATKLDTNKELELQDLGY